MLVRRPPVPLAALLALLATSAAAQAGSDARAERARFRDAAAYSRAHAGDALLVVRGDSVVFEQYDNGYRRDRPHPIASGTKSFACALAAAAVEDGILAWDEPVAATVEEMASPADRARVTVRHLLSLTSGLAPMNLGADGREARYHYANAPLLPMRAAPGERWAYGDAQLDLFGELVRRKLAGRGEDPLAYLERRVLRPIGLSGYTWARDAGGNPLLAGGAEMTARGWARFGMLVRDGGRWQGQAVLREELLGECFRGSAAQPAYGLAFWLNAPTPAGRALYDGHGGLPGMVASLGFGNQNLFVIPSLGLVVVRLGRPDDGYRPRELLARLLGDPVPPPRSAAGAP